LEAPDEMTGSIRVTTVGASAGPGDLIAAIPQPTAALSFVSEGEGVVGWGVFARLETSGPHAAAEIASWWADLCAGLDADDLVHVPGSGPLLFVSLGFTPDDPSVAIVPQAVFGCRDGRRFSTIVDAGRGLTAPVPMHPSGPVSYHDGAFPAAAYGEAVGVAVDRIRAGELSKVVLAHDLVAEAAEPIDERQLLTRLSAAYPTCWTFAVDGLLGASPELLVRRRGRRVMSRVLAGTAWPAHPGEHTAGVVATHLLGSRKDLDEHGYAVDSVRDVLRSVTDDVRVPRAPRALPLANLTHLVTDIVARLPSRAERGVCSASSALALADRLHPTAAVGGTPRAAALSLISELEPTGRGRYAAPVGWMDRHGNGEFALALRCAQVSGSTARLFAGCGIVADSDPATEIREAAVKMIPMREALGA
jgi:menaquinone-specific isochorismate synthase